MTKFKTQLLKKKSVPKAHILSWSNLALILQYVVGPLILISATINVLIVSAFGFGFDYLFLSSFKDHSEMSIIHVFIIFVFFLMFAVGAFVYFAMRRSVLERKVGFSEKLYLDLKELVDKLTLKMKVLKDEKQRLKKDLEGNNEVSSNKQMLRWLYSEIELSEVVKRVHNNSKLFFVNSELAKTEEWLNSRKAELENIKHRLEKEKKKIDQIPDFNNSLGAKNGVFEYTVENVSALIKSLSGSHLIIIFLSYALLVFFSHLFLIKNYGDRYVEVDGWSGARRYKLILRSPSYTYLELETNSDETENLNVKHTRHTIIPTKEIKSIRRVPRNVDDTKQPGVSEGRKSCIDSFGRFVDCSVLSRTNSEYGFHSYKFINNVNYSRPQTEDIAVMLPMFPHDVEDILPSEQPEKAAYDWGKNHIRDLKFSHENEVINRTSLIYGISSTLNACAKRLPEGEKLPIEIVGLASVKKFDGQSEKRINIEKLNWYLAEGRRAAVINSLKADKTLADRIEVKLPNKGKARGLDEFKKALSLRESEFIAPYFQSATELVQWKANEFNFTASEFPLSNSPAIEELFGRSVILRMDKENWAKCRW